MCGFCIFMAHNITERISSHSDYGSFTWYLYSNQKRWQHLLPCFHHLSEKHISLGSFTTEELASRTYREARLILDHAEITLSEYSLFSCLSHDKFVCLINFRDNGIYFKTPIYLRRKYFEYHMSATEILKFDRDDLFFYASKKIQKKAVISSSATTEASTASCPATASVRFLSTAETTA